MPPLSAGQSHIIRKSNNEAFMKDKARERFDLGLKDINIDWENLVGTRKFRKFIFHLMRFLFFFA